MSSNPESGDETKGSPLNEQRRKRMPGVQEMLWDMEAELNSYSVLLRYLGECELKGEHLYGLGLALDRIRRRVVRVSERIHQPAANLPVPPGSGD